MYKRHRFPPEIVQHAVWLYCRFNLGHRDIEDLLAKRDICVSYEAIRLWCNKLGNLYARRLKRRHQGYGDTFHNDELFVKFRGVHHYLWRAVDQDGEVVNLFLQKKRDGATAKRFLRRVLQKSKGAPRKISTDKLSSYGVAHRELMPDAIDDSNQYSNNKAELFHQPTRVRERGMRKFKSVSHAQRFMDIHAAVYNLFNLGRHLVSAKNYQLIRLRAFASWEWPVSI
jgi:putative transposase